MNRNYLATDAFSLIECKRRIKHVKEYLQRYKTQRVLFLAPNNSEQMRELCSSISLQNYDCNDEYNFVSAVELSEQIIRDCVKKNRDLLVDNSNYKFYNTAGYVDDHYEYLRNLFSSTCMCFVNKYQRIDFKVFVCLGSLHHAPRIFYRNSRGRFIYERLSAYDDLQ